MPISSYVIRCAPGDHASVLRELRAWPGLTVGVATDFGIAVAAETATSRAAEEMGERLRRSPGVASAVLVYHNFEDVSDSAPTGPPGEAAATPLTLAQRAEQPKGGGLRQPECAPGGIA